MAVPHSVNIRQLKLLNWNANGLRSKRASFIQFLSMNNVDVACVTETHFLPNETFTLPGYTIYRCDRVADKASGGVALIVRRKLSHTAVYLPGIPALEVVGVKLQFQDGTELLLISAYKAPRYILNATYLSMLFPPQQSNITAWGFKLQAHLLGMPQLKP